MKILIVNISDINGGAARAAYRLHQALLDSGTNSQMLVQGKSSDNYTVIGANSKLQKAMSMLRPMIDNLPIRWYKNRTKTLFSPSWFGFSDIVDRINKINPDIVHLHWICGGMMTIEDMARIKAPIVWSLHDMWAFTGGCHYDEECNEFKNNCGNCKVLGSHKKNDLSSKVFRRKEKTYSKIKNMTIVGLSKWMYECSKSSTLLNNKNHINLPNPIDTNIFKPFSKEQSRELWNLPKDKKLVLFGAIGATSDPRKGFNQLSDAMTKLKNEEIEFVIFGSSEPKNPQNFGFKTHYFGYIHDDVSLVTLYNAIDVMVVPSLQEVFGQTASESMSCGTPVVAFGHTGLLDIVDHKTTGYLAKPFDTQDLANGIEWILNTDDYDQLCQNAREKILREFDSRIIAQKYIKLYKEVLDETTSS